MPQLQNPLLPSVNSYFANLLYFKSWNPQVWNYDEAWLMAWKQIMFGELFGPSVPTADSEGRFNTLITNRQVVTQVIAGRVLNGDGTLTLTFADATYDAFRIQHKVDDSSMNEGIVVAKAPGQITVGPLNNPAAFAAEFALNSSVIDRGKLGGLYNSTGTTSIYNVDDMQEDYCEITRESHQIAAAEKTYRYAGEVGGELKVYGYTRGESDMVRRALFETVYKYFFGQGGTGITTVEGPANKTFGIRNRLIADSGNYIAGAAPITQAQFEQLVGTCADANPGFNQELIALPGRLALKRLSTFYPTQIGFSGGRRDGDRLSISLDVREVVEAGITVKVATNMAFLNDSVRLPAWMQNSIFLLNRSQTMIAGKQRPLIHPIHFSENMSKDYKPLYRQVPGMVGIGASDSTGLPTVDGYQLAGSSTHGAGCEYLDFSGISVIPYGHGLFEYIV